MESEFSGYFENEQLDQLVALCIRLGLADANMRPHLMARIPPGIVNDLPAHVVNAHAQLRGDLLALNLHFVALNGTIPLEEWLRNAVFFKKDHVDGAKLQTCQTVVRNRYNRDSPAFWKQHHEYNAKLLRQTLRRTYLPFSANMRESSDDEIGTLVQAIENAIDRRYRYNKQEYIRNVDRRLAVSWQDGQREVIVLAEELSFEFVLFDDGDLRWEMERTADGAMTIDDYAVSGVTLFEGEPIQPLPVEVSSDRQNSKYTYVRAGCRGGKAYKVQRNRSITWRIDDDPIFQQTSPYVAQNVRLRIANDAEGIAVIYNDVGGSPIFRPTLDAGADHAWDVIRFGHSIELVGEPVLLPDQGYLLVLARMRKEPDAPPSLES